MSTFVPSPSNLRPAGQKLFKPVREAKVGVRETCFRVIGGLIMEDVIKQIVDAEKGAEERIEKAKEDAKAIVLKAREEAKLLEREIIAAAEEKAKALVEKARLEGEEEAKRIIEEGNAEIEELKVKATNNFEKAISAGIELVRGS